MADETLWRFELTWIEPSAATNEAAARSLFDQTKSEINLGPGDPQVSGKLQKWVSNAWVTVDQFTSDPPTA